MDPVTTTGLSVCAVAKENKEGGKKRVEGGSRISQKRASRDLTAGKEIRGTQLKFLSMKERAEAVKAMVSVP